jgi:DNA-binding Lrp family transcriptional regulator
LKIIDDHIQREILFFLRGEKKKIEQTKLSTIVKEVKKTIKVSRNTIINRLEKLITDGYVEAFVPRRSHKVAYRILDLGLRFLDDFQKAFNIPENAYMTLDELAERSQGQPIIIVGPTFALSFPNLVELLKNEFEEKGWEIGITDGQFVLFPSQGDRKNRKQS